ncbi:hypothetical protein B0H16DRAFT_1558574 [Mycena metata]|uniref:Uncharacterized protein n=1 Tax=Mycena metata TaxID=1033252 RepID=A0AAD7N5J0_9AGAR|nr:hypothetical protein B0H16DRAFT_1615004 [Mycena metata]KAJ7745340.1 hypothetical protein B0H16DRAFT_1558574 [Mycena metata]
MDSTTPPRLPLDLERTIFELAAGYFPGSIPILLLVAWRVNKWVEPVLYRLVIVSSRTVRLSDYPVFSHEAISRKINNLEFLRTSVRHLFVEAHSVQAPIQQIVAACDRLKTLAYTPHDSFPDLLRDKQCLQRLTISITAFLGCFPPENESDPQLHSLTHLELLDTHWDDAEEPPDLSTHLALIPNLTHLALNGMHDSASWNNTFRADSRLRCIVFFVDDADPAHPLADDDRVVCVQQFTDYRLDWIHGIDAGKDYWALADIFLAARREGKVDRSQLEIADTDRGIIDNGQWV